MKVTGRIFAAPPTRCAASAAENVVVVAAATMPRGAIQPNEAPFAFGEVGASCGECCDQRSGDEDEHGHQAERREHQMVQRLRGDGGRDGHEHEPNDQLHERLEEGTPGRDIEPAQVGHGQAHDDRGDKPGVVAEDVAACCHAHDDGERGAGAEDLAEPELAQQQPQCRDPDDAADQASTRCSRSTGRTKASSGPTTVGPETTRMAPVSSAAPCDMPSTGVAQTAPTRKVTGTPSKISLITTRPV
jgi:hypothetical protein